MDKIFIKYREENRGDRERYTERERDLNSSAVQDLAMFKTHCTCGMPESLKSISQCKGFLLKLDKWGFHHVQHTNS